VKKKKKKRERCLQSSETESRLFKRKRRREGTVMFFFFSMCRVTWCATHVFYVQVCMCAESHTFAEKHVLHCMHDDVTNA
jgi:hypothetical protein